MMASLPARPLLALAAARAPLPTRPRPRSAILLPGFSTLIACLLVGEGVVVLLDLPVPGSVVGLGLMLAGLSAPGERRRRRSCR